ncbi:hypothetical protein Acor_66380 [Acrocarpospora corrugata]|uniref:DUF4352 domain-containing protein n=1 Tax=Acrocarpospora corrugata TaxID=35763 RepID=A0A5M3W8K4_9ACTN|nr:DUF4352 domain-containing protein [Acrocarpospora corrugata]GES04570.1 hypothetical protein Acor_66380 [Acrocarpospora corrugata]
MATATRTRPRVAPAPTPPRRGFARRAGAAVLGVALCACAVYAQALAMPYEQLGSNLTSHATLGETTATGRFSVRATSVVAAKAVDTRDYSGKVSKVQTSHVFLIVAVTATAPKEPLRFDASTTVLVTADGKRYRATDKVDRTLTLFEKWVQPGFWSTGNLIFEVPVGAVPGASVIVASPSGGFLVDSFAPEVEIDLRLTGSVVSGAEEYHPLVAA